MRSTPDEKRQADLFGGTDAIPNSGKRPNPMRALFGAGPLDAYRESVRCGSCRFLIRFRQVSRWAKCSLRLNTGGRGTDHLVSWPACGKYEAGAATHETARRVYEPKGVAKMEPTTIKDFLVTGAHLDVHADGAVTHSVEITGASLRDKGAELALANATELWLRRIDVALSKIGGDFTSEDLRFLAGPPPGHPNALPAVILNLTKAGQIVWTGKLRPSKRKSSHAAMLKVWRKP